MRGALRVELLRRIGAIRVLSTALFAFDPLFVLLAIGHSGTVKTGTAKVCTAKKGTAKVDIHKAGIAKVGTAKEGIAKVSTAKAGTAKVDTAKVGNGKVDTAKVGTAKRFSLAVPPQPQNP